MTITKITALPPAPVVTDTESQFASKASAFVSALDGFVTDANALASDVDSALGGSLVQFDGFAGVWSAGTFNSGQVVFHTPSDAFYIALADGETAEPPGGDWRQLGTAESTSYENTTSGLAATDVQAAIDEVAAASPSGYFAKSDRDSVAWTKTGNDTAETGQTIYVEVGGSVLEISSGTTIAMPTLTAGTDYAIWVAPDGTLEADDSFNVAPTSGGRRIGGFHYAPGGNASLDPAGDWNNHTGGDTTPQINEYSFYDLKWRPSVADPRGLTLVNESFWTGIYLMSATTTVAPLHKYNVEPARDGNNPQKPYGDGTTYGNAKPMNVFECLSYYGFRAPDVNEFQLLALGTTEETSAGGSGPGNTGDMGDSRDKERFTSAWGVMDATGVLRVWGRDSLPDNNQDSGVTEGRSDNIFRISRFAPLGGFWGTGSGSGSRLVGSDPSSRSGTDDGGRGVCDHVILP